MDYEFTLVFDLDLNHHCKASKDRTSLFIGKPEFVITSETGETILNWCNTGTTLEERHGSSWPGDAGIGDTKGFGLGFPNLWKVIMTIMFEGSKLYVVKCKIVLLLSTARLRL